MTFQLERINGDDDGVVVGLNEFYATDPLLAVAGLNAVILHAATLVGCGRENKIVA